MVKTKIIIAGSRDHKPSWFAIHTLLDRLCDVQGFNVLHVGILVGDARGVDHEVRMWATSAGVPRKDFIADWGQHGKAAGPIRNQAMVDEADALIAIWDGQSPGTKDVIQRAREKGIPVVVQTIEREPDPPAQREEAAP